MMDSDRMTEIVAAFAADSLLIVGTVTGHTVGIIGRPDGQRTVRAALVVGRDEINHLMREGWIELREMDGETAIYQLSTAGQRRVREIKHAAGRMQFDEFGGKQ
jgi:hypothetical protein